jgi:hypothetical protein
MEVCLNKEFNTARAEGQEISSCWFLVYAKAIYCQLHPCRILQDEVTGRFEYELFSFLRT